MILLTGGRQKLLGTREGETTTTITIEQTAIQRHTVVYTAVERGGLDARVCYSCRCAWRIAAQSEAGVFSTTFLIVNTATCAHGQSKQLVC